MASPSASGVNKAEEPIRAISDHRKRKKESDMNENGVSGPVKAKLELKWSQSEEDISMTTLLGSGDGAADRVAVSFTDQAMTIAMPDGSEQSWCFHGAIVKDRSSVQRKKRKFTIKVFKQQPGLWPALEKVECPASAPGVENVGVSTDHVAEEDKKEFCDGQEILTKEEEPVQNIQHVKHDFFEKDGNLTVHIYVKGVNKDAVKVHFQSQSFIIKFQSADPKFLQLHEGTSEDTVFRWSVVTKNAIQPSMCNYKITDHWIQLTLKKASPERWASLEAPQRKDVPASSKPSSWIPAKSTSSNPDGASEIPASAESSVAFDEMSQVDLNDEDSAASPEPSSVPSLSASQLNNSFRNQAKPTAKVQPLNKLQVDIPVVLPGFTGLDNLGNTCFMNSVIQVLSNTREFRDFFLDGRFQREINTDNALGSGGHLAVSFGVLLKNLWSATKYSCAPSKLKDLVAQKASQFTGYAQHDAQEFLAFFLDGLHEDLNRVKNKPYTKTVDSDGRPDEIVAAEAWELYKKRDNSFLVDLFHGQYKSKLVCPVCGKVSITFDPFLYLSVPLPKKKKTIAVTFMWRDPHRKPVRYLIQLVKDASVEHLKEILSRKTGVRPSQLRVYEAYKGLFHKHFLAGSDLSVVQPNDTIIVAEVLSTETAGEEVVEIPVIQRTIIPHQFPSRCSACHKECESGNKLKRCTKCFKVGYCDQTCQRNHWQAHKTNCNQSPEPVGCPFFLSLPRSHCTYSRIARLMEGHARYSVDTFQPPVKADNSAINSEAGSSQIPSTLASTSVSNATANAISGVSGVCGQGGASSTVGGTLPLPSRSSVSNLSSSSGSQSSGSLSSLDSVSSCSSTATLTADCPRARFDFDSDDGKEKEDHDEKGEGNDTTECCMTVDGNSGVGDVESRVESPTLLTQTKTATQLNYGAGDFMTSLEGTEKELGPRQSCTQESFCLNVEEKSAPTNPVLGVQAHPVTERSVPLFFIKPVNEYGHGVKGNAGERLSDEGDISLDLSQHEYLSMDWRNSDRLPSYVLVQSKPLEADEDDSVKSVFSDSADLTLHQCLELFTEPEVLAPDEAWYCPQCKEHREATKQMSIWRLPHTLIIQLKRFSFRNFIWRDKIDKMVDFPTRELDMTPYTMGAPRAGDPPPIYDLYGVVNHHGGILGGHYTSYARCADLAVPLKNEVGWRLFDDSRVSSIGSEKNTQTKAGYLLFYRRRAIFVPAVDHPLDTSCSELDSSQVPEQNEVTEVKPIMTADVEGSTETEDEESFSNRLYKEPISMDMDPSPEKFDREKDDLEEDDDFGDANGQLVITFDQAKQRLDYTDMDAVD